MDLRKCLFSLLYFLFLSNFASASMRARGKIFHVYTAGIINWGDFAQEDQNLIKHWNKGFRKNILKRIPRGFTVAFHHYDPLYQMGGKKSSKRVIKKIMAYVDGNLVAMDLTKSRVVSSEFVGKAFYADLVPKKEPYLFIDLAHIYNYPAKIGRVKIAGNYGQDYKAVDGKEIALKALRFGFLGNGIGAHLARLDIFRVGKDGSVLTYLDLAIQLKISYEEGRPSDFLDDLSKKIELGVEREVKRQKNAHLFQIEHIVKKITSEKSRLAKILELLWLGRSFDSKEIVDFIVSSIIKKHQKVIDAGVAKGTAK